MTSQKSHMFGRLNATLLATAALAFIASRVHADEAADTAAKDAAHSVVNDVGEAFIKSDFSAVLDRTLPAAIELDGGREKMLKEMQDAVASMKGQGITFEKFAATKPEKVYTDGKGGLYVVVPVVLHMNSMEGKMEVYNYFVACSIDGKKWLVVDGDVLGRSGAKEKVLPSLPAAVKLPEPKEPKLTPKD